MRITGKTFFVSATALLVTGAAAAPLQPFSGDFAATFTDMGGDMQPLAQASPLPPCPAMVNGVPEFPHPSGEAWQPGVNCIASTANAQATGAPIDTTKPVGDQTAQPSAEGSGSSGGGVGNPFAGSSGSSNDSSAQGTTNPSQPQGPEAPADGGGAGGLAGPGSSAGLNGDSGQNGAMGGLGGLRGYVGLSLAMQPNYLGAEEGRTPLGLIIDASFGQNGFINNEDGLGFYVLSLGSLESSVSINTAYGQIFDGKTSGLAALKRYTQFEADVVVQTATLAYEVELAVPLSGPDGWTLTGSVGQEGPLGIGGAWDARLGVTYASNSWMDSYYGISAAEAAASGLSAYDPKGSLRNLFLEAGADVPINDTWGLDLAAGTRFMLGQAAKAPQVKDAGSKTDYYGHVGIYYRF